MCHLSSYSFHILVMTFGAETVLDWPVFLSAVRIFVTASVGHPGLLKEMEYRRFYCDKNA